MKSFYFVDFDTLLQKTEKMASRKDHEKQIELPVLVNAGPRRANGTIETRYEVRQGNRVVEAFQIDANLHPR